MDAHRRLIAAFVRGREAAPTGHAQGGFGAQRQAAVQRHGGLLREAALHRFSRHREERRDAVTHGVATASRITVLRPSGLRASIPAGRLARQRTRATGLYDSARVR